MVATARKITHFLLVEDDQDHADLFQLALEEGKRADQVLHHVVNGAEALAYIQRRHPYTDAPRPDLVILDLNLPKVSGHEVLACIKNSPQLRIIPVVVLTTSSSETDCKQAYANHANSYLVKPFDFERFRQMIREVRSYWMDWNHAAIGMNGRITDSRVRLKTARRTPALS